MRVGALALTALAGRPAANGGPTKLLRMPTVSATQIAFAYANKIWTVERAGGMARRLTSFQGQSTNPHFSPDGRGTASARVAARSHPRFGDFVIW